MGDQSKPRLCIDLNVPYAKTLIRILFNTERGKKNLTVTMLWVAVFLFSGILTAHGKATHDNAARRLNDALGIGNKVFPVEGKTYVYINEKRPGRRRGPLAKPWAVTWLAF